MPNDSARRPAALTGVQLGLGLTQLGRRWGFRAAGVPSEEAARALLAFAVESGIRVFDTAPSYGRSEERFGRFLGALAPPTRSAVVIMTKCGEQWDESSGVARVDHRYDALVASIERSLERLQRVDVLQLHRTSAESLRSGDVRRALARARALGIQNIGASVSDLESARIALDEIGVTVLQFPYSRGNSYMAPAFELAAAVGSAVVVNRPLFMGRLLYTDASATEANTEAIAAAYRFVRAQRFHGAVLTGTSSPAHLATDIACFARATAAPVTH